MMDKRLALFIGYALMLLLGIKISTYSNGRKADSSLPTISSSINPQIHAVNRISLRSFYDIASKYKTDKVNIHHYEKMYEKYVSKYVGQPVKMLEIGLGCGMPKGPGGSAHTWRDYLGHQAEIHFIEFNQACGEEWRAADGKDLNITLHYGSQEDVKFLEKFNEMAPPFDFIVDDGGHTMNQQITSFKYLLGKVKSGGLYVIEDLLTSYMAGYGGGYLSNTSTISMIKTIVDDIQAISPVKVVDVSKKIFSFELSDEICVFTLK